MQKKKKPQRVSWKEILEIIALIIGTLAAIKTLLE